MEVKLFQVKAILKAITYGFGDAPNERRIFRTDVQITQCKDSFSFDEFLLKAERFEKLKITHEEHHVI